MIKDSTFRMGFYHPSLAEIVEFKLKKKVQKIEKYLWEEKEHLLRLENTALKNHARLYLYHQILMSVPKIFNINKKSDFNQHTKTIFKKNISRNSLLEIGTKSEV